MFLFPACFYVLWTCCISLYEICFINKVLLLLLGCFVNQSVRTDRQQLLSGCLWIRLLPSPDFHLQLSVYLRTESWATVNSSPAQTYTDWFLLVGVTHWQFYVVCWCYLWSPVSLSPADLLVTSSPTVCNWWWRAACEHLLPSYQTLTARLVINCLVSSFLTELLWTCSLTVCVNSSWLGFTCQADYWSLLTP